jgi:hypothetical protein
MLDPAAWFWGPGLLAAAVGVVGLVARKRRTVLRAGAVALFLLLVAQGGAAFWSWFFRDGLGPGFVPTQGTEAWRRFWSEYQTALAIGFVQALMIGFALRWRLRSLRSGPA